MKKLSKLLTLAVGFATLFLAACSDASDSGFVGTGITDKTAIEKEYEVTLYTEDGTALDLSKWGVPSASADNSARTIVADGLGADLADTGKVKFYLWGENQLSTTDTSIANPVEKKFTLDTGSISTGKVTLGLSASRWNLKLAAVSVDSLGSVPSPTEEQVKSAALYIGYANVDLRSATSIKFYLTASGLTGSGTAKLTLKYDGCTGGKGTWSTDHIDLVKDSNKYSIKANITSRLVNTTNTAQSLDVTKFFPATPTATSTAADATGDEKIWTVSPGTYNFEVTFTSVAGNGDLAKEYVWSDIIIILPNQVVEKEVLVPDVVLYKPVAPDNFKVGYITPATTVTNTYNAVLTWEDKSNNEKFFEIQVANLAGATAPLTTAITTADDNTDDDAWTAALAGTSTGSLKTFGESFYGNTDLGWVAGSLVKNNKGAVVKLALGARYLMRIAAVNDAGHSSWTYATYDLTTPTGASATPISLNNGLADVTYTPNPYAIKQVDDSQTAWADIYQPVASKFAICASLYRLTYHLNGGIYTFNDTTSVPVAPDKTNELVYYLSQRAELTAVPTTTTVGKIDPSTRTTHVAAGIEIFTPTGDPDATAAGEKVPALVKSGNRWTSWRRGAIEGAYYQNTVADYTGMSDSDATALAATTTTITTTTSASGVTPAVTNSLDVYIPQNYHGYQNLDLFASYTVASAIVDIYVDENYDFYDVAPASGTATFGTDYELELGTNSNLTKSNNKYYTFTYNGTTSGTELTLNYKQKTGRTPAFKYDSISVEIKKMAGSNTVAVGTLDASTNSYSFDIAPFGDGVFYITVVGEYKGHQYSYGITLNIVDATGQP